MIANVFSMDVEIVNKVDRGQIQDKRFGYGCGGLNAVSWQA